MHATGRCPKESPSKGRKTRKRAPDQSLRPPPRLENRAREDERPAPAYLHPLHDCPYVSRVFRHRSTHVEAGTPIVADERSVVGIDVGATTDKVKEPVIAERCALDHIRKFPQLPNSL